MHGVIILCFSVCACEHIICTIWVYNNCNCTIWPNIILCTRARALFERSARACALMPSTRRRRRRRARDPLFLCGAVWFSVHMFHVCVCVSVRLYVGVVGSMRFRFDYFAGMRAHLQVVYGRGVVVCWALLRVIRGRIYLYIHILYDAMWARGPAPIYLYGRVAVVCASAVLRFDS